MYHLLLFLNPPRVLELPAKSSKPSCALEERLVRQGSQSITGTSLLVSGIYRLRASSEEWPGDHLNAR